ncbi:MAG TPA: transposase [Candidatus Thermoplasmatota archaeon]|nr:transposase [Candidatus Thermoplasmatota archaeon]
MFKKRFGSFLDLNVKRIGQYSKDDLLDLILHLCNTVDFAENGSKTFQLQRTNVPNGDTLLHHLKGYQDIDQIKHMFIAMFEMIWETAKKANQLQRIVDCSIDYTSQHFYGDKGAPMVTEMKPDHGTAYDYKFATITISEHNQRFTLLAVPVGPFDTKEDILNTLLDYALQRVKIRCLYVDRGFFDSNCIELFKRYHLKFLMPCTVNERIKRILEVVPSPTVIKDYEMKKTTFNVIVISDEFHIKRAFATNIDFNENDVGLAERLFNLYSKRWTIETSYRVKKHSFRPKTTSKNYFIRLFYFLFSALMYNLWLLADILICLAMLDFYNGKHIITSNTIEQNENGLNLAGTPFTTVSQNNFLNNENDANFTALITKIIGVFTCIGTRFQGNYWGEARLLPKIIPGTIDFTRDGQNFTRFNLLKIDWHPAQEPYDIGV